MQSTYDEFLFSSINPTLWLLLGPSKALVWLEIGVSYFPELPLWVDVESSLKNRTSRFFVLPATGHCTGKCGTLMQSNC